MKIIKRIADSIVVFAGVDLVLEQDGCSGAGWKFRNVDVSTLTIETVDYIPAGFVGGGWTYADGVWTSNEIADQAVLPGKRAGKIAHFTALAAAEVYAPIEYQGHFWNTDPDGRALLAQVLAVGSVPQVMYWRDASGTPREMTYADLQGLGYAILVRGLGIDQNLMTKTIAISSAATAAEVESIIW